ncbi:MAG TPA: aspartate carbamoyltransferase catalytic subunit [Nitrospirae bacterium]|nr:aspartate carbamoyltransferase catalytic subunit [Nitrospirota bacterium]HDL20885.1 aspartate carbamoyltransferase catalytic subunit [Nitrospirota bacterium]HDZ03002.1 aspartate carbamoyltransferase catalytic subunit [Nitrospirota bacterium]
MMINSKDLLGIKELAPEEIYHILDTAAGFKDVLLRDIKKVPPLRGKTVVSLFFEPSTRTRTSFALASKRLSADVVNFSVTTSSVVKGETLKDTALTIQSLGADFVVIRHGSSGVPHLLGNLLNISVINAGDGANEHPTQALLDLFTIQSRKKKIKGLTVAIIGDIAHSRVAKSNIYALTKLGAKVRVICPPTLMPAGIEKLGIDVFHSIDEGIRKADVIMALRLQLERQSKGFLPSLEEYFNLYGLTDERLKLAKEDAIVMHPGPMNRGVEIESAVADGPQSVILEQVTNGLAVRMAVLYLLSGVKK